MIYTSFVLLLVTWQLFQASQHTHTHTYTDLSDRAGRLVDHSRAYKKEARYLNLRQSLAAKIAIAIVIFLILIFLRYMIF